MFCLVPARKEGSLVTDHLDEELCSEGGKHQLSVTLEEATVVILSPVLSPLTLRLEERLKPTGAIVWETFPVWGPGVGVATREEW